MKISIPRMRYNHRRRVGNVGDTPGAIVIPEGALKPLISVYSYNEKELVCSEGTKIKVILDQFKKCDEHTHWIQVRGLDDIHLIEEIEKNKKKNTKKLEDIT